MNRDSARKTLERIFLKDKAQARPLEARSRNFIPLPKRRGGRIWTRYANKVHPVLVKGIHAKLKVTPQVAKDLKSVADLVELAAA